MKADKRSAAASAVFDNSGTCLGVAVLAAVVSGYFARHSAPVYVAPLGIAVIALTSILASLRFYNPWWSWAGWFVPLLLAGVVIAPLRVGVISPFTAVFAYSLAAVCVFGVLFVGRHRLKKWVTAGSCVR
jgi:hypothetical protein